MAKVFNSIEEMKRYYDEETNTYRFRENYKLIDEIIINFDLNIESNIEARDVRATSITAKNIQARDITVWDINACDIGSSCINAGVIQARNVSASSIKTMNLYARDITAFRVTAVNIYARDIIYFTMCFAYKDFKYNSIKCGQQNPIHFSKYGKLEVAENDNSV